MSERFDIQVRQRRDDRPAGARRVPVPASSTGYSTALQGRVTTAIADRVVVTGAAGFIASHLVDALLYEGYRVVALDRRTMADDAIAATNLADASRRDKLQLHQVDLAVDDVRDLTAGTLHRVENSHAASQ